MASLALGIGMSHGPSIEMSPDQWAKLAEKDTWDPRFDYQELLTTARDGLADEITEDAFARKYAAAHAGIAKLVDVFKQAKPDVMVVVSNPHRGLAPGHNPVMSVFRAAEFPVKLRSSPTLNFTKGSGRPDSGPSKVIKLPGAPGLADHLMDSLIEDGFDIGCTDEFPEGESLDGAFSFPQHWLLDGATVPTVPFMLSRDLPNQATPKRCLQLGQAIRKAVDSWSSDAKVAIVASGGLSHQVVDEELDDQVIKAFVGGDIDSLAGLSRERLNRGPGTPEILNWIVVAAAASPVKMQLIDYLACYRSLAGTGHGITFGYWQ
jgi:3-O-methylgallate 3,4-dioxygenase